MCGGMIAEHVIDDPASSNDALMHNELRRSNVIDVYAPADAADLRIACPQLLIDGTAICGTLANPRFRDTLYID